MTDQYAKNPMARESPDDRRVRESAEWVESHRSDRYDKPKKKKKINPDDKQTKIGERLSEPHGVTPLNAGSAWMK
jgi:hypothetical protein|tara:strand:+ start:130 stop:354 length:225 start_codon:yes stop_codon:yes gene_type:complete